MYRFLLTFGLLVSLMACDSVEQYREAIDGLSTDWDATTSTVTALAEKVGAEKSTFLEMLGGMNVTEEITNQVGEETANKLTELKSQFEGFGGNFDGITSQISSFVGGWTEKAGTLESLKEGLSSGDLSGVSDVLGTIGSLKEAITGAKSKVTEWTGKLDETTSGYQAVAEQFKALLPATESAN